MQYLRICNTSQDHRSAHVCNTTAPNGGCIRRRWDAPSSSKARGEDLSLEMGELLPEFWVTSRDGEGDNKERRARQGRKVTDLCTWLQCYAIYVAVLGPQEPQVIPDLMAYMGFVIRVSQDHEGLGWVRYDSAFRRRQAALSGNKRGQC